MVYLDIINNENELLKKNEEMYSAIFKKLIIIYRKWTSSLIFKVDCLGEILKIQKVNQKSLLKLSKQLTMYGIKKICLSKELMDNNTIIKFFDNNKIEVVNGERLKKYLIFQFIECICNNKEEDFLSQEVAILTKDNNILINNTIEKIGKKVKNINIITNNKKHFEKIESKMYEEYGVIVNISNNFKKSLSSSDIIINYDFNESELNQYKIPKFACVLNINDYIDINKKGFEGINIKNYKMSVNKKLNKGEYKNFENNYLYECEVLKNSNCENILNKLERDKVKITQIYGKREIIRKKEFVKLKKVM